MLLIRRFDLSGILLYFFHSDPNIFLTSLLVFSSSIQCFKCSNSLVTLLLIELDPGLKRAVWYFEIKKRCVPQYSPFGNNMTISIIEFINFRFYISRITLCSDIWYPFFFLPCLSQLFFLHFLQMINIFGQMKTFFVDLMIELSHIMTHQSVGYRWVEQQTFWSIFSFWWIYHSFSRVFFL